MREDFANPRNAASGSLRQKDPLETKKFLSILLLILLAMYKNILNTIRFLKELKKWGFKTNNDNKIFYNIKELIKFHQSFESKRFDLEYDVDGLVYKVNDFKLQERLDYLQFA